jgi:hypothetical protein
MIAIAGKLTVQQIAAVTYSPMFLNCCCLDIFLVNFDYSSYKKLKIIVYFIIIDGVCRQIFRVGTEGT